MINHENDPGRGLNQETLRRVTDLSKLKQETGTLFTVTAEMVGPYTDKINVLNPDGTAQIEFIEEA